MSSEFNVSKAAPTKPEPRLVATAGRWGTRSVAGDIMETTLTPQRIRDWLLAAETGDIAAQSELFERMEERDGELDAHLRTRKSGVSSLKWDIQPADETPAAAAAADYAREIVTGIPDMQRVIFDLLDAIPKGFAVQEIEWQTTRKEWRPVKVHYRPQRWFLLAEDGETLRLRDTANYQGVDINPLNFIVHNSPARSGFRGRTSLLRSCVRAFVVRHYSWKDWMGFAEVYGMPVRIGELREGVPWDSDEAKELYAAVRGLGMDMAAVVREGNKINILDTQKAGEGRIFQMIIEAASREMVLAILGQTLTSGGEKGGSFALGKVQNQVRWDLLESDALALDRTMTEQLLKPIIVLNKGEGAPVPRWHTGVEQPEDLVSLSTVVKTLGEAGLAIPAKWTYTKFGIPEPAKGEATLQPQAKAPMFSNEVGRVGQETALLNQSSPAARAVRRAMGELWIAERRIATPEAWEALSAAGRQRAWFAAGLDVDGIGELARLFEQGMREGKGQSWWLDQVERARVTVPGAEVPGPGQLARFRADLWWNQNIAATNAADSWIKAQDAKAERPAMQYHSMPDARPAHRDLNGTIKLVDDPFWNSFLPPWEYGCRCWTTTLSLADMEREGLSPTEGEPTVPPNPDWVFENRDAYYIEARGEAPVTEVGQRDAEILRALTRI